MRLVHSLRFTLLVTESVPLTGLLNLEGIQHVHENRWSSKCCVADASKDNDASCVLC